MAETLSDTDRQWPLPSCRPSIHMMWHDLLFMHWPVPARELRPLIPVGLEIDTFEGEAWIGVVPFRMTGVGPPSLSRLPWLSAFPELNVRTYVTSRGKPGVWFLSLDAAQPVAVWVARRTFRLPYFHARITCRREEDNVSFQSRRLGSSKGQFIARYRPTSAAFRARPHTFEYWLTARYCLYCGDRRGCVYRGEIDHRPWPLSYAHAEVQANTMTHPLGIELPSSRPHLLFADAVDVLAWPIRVVES